MVDTAIPCAPTRPFRLRLRLRRALGPVAVCCGCLVVIAAVFVAGQSFGERRARQAPFETLAGWRSELDGQREQLERARRTAADQVDALAVRLGQMHAQLLRLDALGKRLTQMARLKAGEFDFDGPPAIGGPQAALSGTAAAPLFPSLLDEVARTIDDRERQLAALESVILARELTRQVLPSGRPVLTGYLSSQFGRRVDPFTGHAAFHAGVDFVGAAGDPVLAVAAGVVSHAGPGGGYGQLVEITHAHGLVTRYAHNQSVLVAQGATVRQGETIAVLGSTGRSTGPHVHFEVLQNGTPVDPLRFMRRTRS
jgi:murein DD-endopeptidase MepM/ murein hydrolase activator NlpD